MKKIILIICIQFVFGSSVFSQNKISNKSSDWSDASAWTPSGVPTSTNNVTIADGHTIILDINASCNLLTIGTGGSATLKFTGNAGRSLVINSHLTVNVNSTLRPRSSSNTTHTINIRGNIINNGTFDLARDATSTCDIIFSNNGNQSVSGNGIVTEFDGITVNMGTSRDNVLDITSSNFVAANNFLTLVNGTFKLSTPNAVNISPYSAIAAIPVNAGLWINSGNAVVTTSAGINLEGRITLSNGILNIGNAADQDLAANGGTLIVSGGSLNIAGKYNATGSANTFNISGGTITVPSFGSTNTSIAPFQITAAASQFNMTGGTIILPREGGSGAQDLGFVNTGSTSGAISGGTLQVGESGMPTNQTFNINTTYSVSNLQIANANATAKILTNNLSVSNNITISSGILNANNLAINLGGNWNNAGTFTPGTGTVNFSSNLTQSIFRSGGETFYHLAFNGTGVKTFSSAVSTTGNFSLSTNSNVDINAANHQLTVKGNFTNNGTFNARNGLVLFNGTS